MAKRPTRSQADDTTGATPSPRRGRRTRSTGAAAAPPSTAATSATSPQGGGKTAEAEAPPEFDIAQPEAITSESMSMASEPSEEDIRLRAYHRYLARGDSHGTDFEDWLEAERDLRQNR
jgi:Protein of unknown function (DUF2934)